jgi:hypothetical protein
MDIGCCIKRLEKNVLVKRVLFSGFYDRTFFNNVEKLIVRDWPGVSQVDPRMFSDCLSSS